MICWILICFLVIFKPLKNWKFTFGGIRTHDLSLSEELNALDKKSIFWPQIHKFWQFWVRSLQWWRPQWSYAPSYGVMNCEKMPKIVNLWPKYALIIQALLVRLTYLIFIFLQGSAKFHKKRFWYVKIDICRDILAFFKVTCFGVLSIFLTPKSAKITT